MINNTFNNRVIDYEKLLDYGFKKLNNIFIYSTYIFDKQFELTINIDSKGTVSDTIFELATGEKYFLHKISSAQGTFVGQIREEYEKIMSDVFEKCSFFEVFKGKQTLRIIEYVKEKYGDNLEFLWEKFPKNAIVRRKDNSKWYAVFLTVNKKKLGLDQNETIEILDLRGKPEDIEKIIDNKNYFPGYHMNKKHWFTLYLNNSISDDVVFKKIDISYEIAKKK